MQRFFGIHDEILIRGKAGHPGWSVRPPLINRLVNRERPISRRAATGRHTDGSGISECTVCDDEVRGDLCAADHGHIRDRNPETRHVDRRDWSEVCSNQRYGDGGVVSTRNRADGS